MIQIDITNLSKSYGKTEVLSNLDLTLTNQQINFLIGANGTGKSTFLKCLLKLIKYQGRIIGNNVAIAYMPERLILPDYISVRNFLLLISEVRGVEKEEAIITLNYYFEKFKIKEHQEKSIVELSKGTKQKVLLIQALMTKADIYIFDEPINGLDPSSQQEFLKEVANLRRNKKLIIITTHNLSSYRFRNKKVIDFNNKNQYEFSEITS